MPINLSTHEGVEAPYTPPEKLQLAKKAVLDLIGMTIKGRPASLFQYVKLTPALGEYAEVPSEFSQPGLQLTEIALNDRKNPFGGDFNVRQVTVIGRQDDEGLKAVIFQPKIPHDVNLYISNPRVGGGEKGKFRLMDHRTLDDEHMARVVTMVAAAGELATAGAFKALQIKI